MAEPKTDRCVDDFIHRLQQFEQDQNPDPLIELFSPDAELWSITEREPVRGQEAARAFWKQYRSAFGQIQSQFQRISQGDGLAVLEWQSEGTLPDGNPVTYRGVSLLETDGQCVHKFRTYYDTAPFLTPESRAGH